MTAISEATGTLRNIPAKFLLQSKCSGKGIVTWSSDKVWDVCVFPLSGSGLRCPIFTTFEIARSSLKVFSSTPWVWAADRGEILTHAHTVFLTVSS